MLSIGRGAFDDSRKITEVTSFISIPFDIEDDVFESEVYDNARLAVPKGSKTRYQQTEGWKNFKTIIEMEEPFAGDVNLDGEVGIGDIVAVTNAMAGVGSDTVAANADVNGDGEVGIGDIVAITNIMAGSAAARQQ